MMRTYSLAQHGQFIRIIAIGFLILITQIPVAWIESLVEERRHTRDRVVADITQKWGTHQEIVGPHIVLPYVIPGKSNAQGWIEKDRTGHITIMPSQFSVDAEIDSEIRHRSIYGIPIYRAKVRAQGRFDLLAIQAEYDDGQRQLLWDRAVLNVGISDPKGIKNKASLHWKQRPLPLVPGVGKNALCQGGFHAQLDGLAPADALPFTLTFELGGYDSFRVVPLGRDSTIRIQSDWSDPSFQGNWLPTQRQVDETGFTAEWQIPFLGRNFPEHWDSARPVGPPKLSQSAVGVDLIYPLDAYGKTQRSTKYSLLFIGLTFVGFWLFELLGRLRIHIMQYLLVGAAVTLFYLLLLSLSEHIGFFFAYMAAASMTLGAVTAYSKKLVKKRGRVLMVGVGLAALYAYLLTLLEEQDYALLSGALALFGILSAIMYLTRNIDWSDLRNPDVPQVETDAA